MHRHRLLALPRRRLARLVVDHPWIVLSIWLVLSLGAVHFALLVTSDNSPNRLIVEGDEDYEQTRAFQKIFPEGQYVVCWRGRRPVHPASLTRVIAIEQALASVPK
jgi:predicted RND superfamily exporter protein